MRPNEGKSTERTPPHPATSDEQVAPADWSHDPDHKPGTRQHRPLAPSEMHHSHRPVRPGLG